MHFCEDFILLSLLLVPEGFADCLHPRCLLRTFISTHAIGQDNYIGCVVASFLLGLGSEGIRFLRGKVKEMKETAVINVEGMTCNACVQSIEGRVGERAGVFSIKVSLEEGTATIKHDASAETTETLCDAIDDMGFDATAADPEERCHNLGKQCCVSDARSFDTLHDAGVVVDVDISHHVCLSANQPHAIFFFHIPAHMCCLQGAILSSLCSSRSR